jgi:hypothetical protein
MGPGGRASIQERTAAVVQVRRSPSVTTQHAIYQTADKGNAETWAAVAIVAIARVIDRSTAPVVATAISGAMTATSISAPGVSAHCVSAHCMSAHCMSAAVTTAGVAGS